MVLGLASFAALLALGLGFLLLGTPQASSSVSARAAAPPASAEVPPPEADSPLAIEVPGCVCHSDDPAVVEEHSRFRMNQCFGCHAGGMPAMGR